MGTLADLKTRIIAETARDDLSDDMASDLNTVIASAIDQFAAERWWFTEARRTSTIVVDTAFQAIPTGIRFIDRLFLIVGGNRYEMRCRTPSEIDNLQTAAANGQPTDYAFLGSDIYVWPTPNTAWTLLWEAVVDVTPALDYTAAAASQSNDWTNSGAELIVAQSKIRLYRDYLSANAADPRLTLAVSQGQEAYQRLKAETNRRLTSGRVRPSW